MRTEELDGLGQLMIKQLKSRYNDTNYYKRFVVGIDLEHFRLHDVDNATAQQIADKGRTDDTPVFDKSQFSGKKKWDFATELDFS